MRIILRYRVLKGKLTKGHHSFYLDIYQDGKRAY
jgi:integrase/recombinase XerD